LADAIDPARGSAGFHDDEVNRRRGQHRGGISVGVRYEIAW
jgi:hypothetical protein